MNVHEAIQILCAHEVPSDGEIGTFVPGDFGPGWVTLQDVVIAKNGDVEMRFT